MDKGPFELEPIPLGESEIEEQLPFGQRERSHFEAERFATFVSHRHRDLKKEERKERKKNQDQHYIIILFTIFVLAPSPTHTKNRRSNKVNASGDSYS